MMMHTNSLLCRQLCIDRYMWFYFIDPEIFLQQFGAQEEHERKVEQADM